MKKLFVSLALACMVICSYAQQDIKARDRMEIASVETNDNEITLYKVKEADGNSGFYLVASHVLVSFSVEILESTTTFSSADGTLLYFGASADEVLDKLDALIDLFSEPAGAQMEFTCRDGSTVAAILRKGLFGKYLDIRDTNVSKSDIKSLKNSFKIARKLHPGL
jgi:hypothetical protein